MKLNKMNTGKYLIASTSILIAMAILMFVSFTATSVFSVNNDAFNMTVDIGNTGPTIDSATMLFNDSVAGADIQLTASSDTNIVSCNATASDVNGWQDIVSAAATFYHTTSTSAGLDDKNNHYRAGNGSLAVGSCNLGSGSGNTVPVVCQIYLEHEATNGTWTCNITVNDSGSLNAWNTTTNTVAQLVAMTVYNDTIAYGSMSPNTNSSTLAANVTNEGNVRIGVNVNGTAMVCNVTGSIPLANIKYNGTSAESYASGNMVALTGSAVQVAGFTLVPQGIAPFADDQNATLNTYWAIGVPVGVKGTCTGTVTVTAIAV